MRAPRAVTAALLISLLCVAPGARAGDPVDDATRTRARTLGEEGNRLYDSGDYKGALEMYERASLLVDVPTLGLKSARCLEKLGRFIEASERYLAVTRVTLPADALDVHKEAIVSAEQERAALLPRIPSVILRVEGAASPSVTLDARPLSVALVGVKTPVDPGEHTVEVKSTEGSAKGRFTAREGQTAEMTLRIVPTRRPPPPIADRPWLSPLHGIGIGAIVAGAGGLAGGVATTVVLASKKSELEGTCGRDLKSCPESNDDIDGYNALRVPSTVLWIAGGVFAATGIVLVAIPQRARDEIEAKLRVGPAGVSLEGAF